MKRFLVAPEAVQDLRNIRQFIARDSSRSADRMMERFHAAFLKLALTPGIGHSREDLAGDRPILFFSVGHYLVLYRATRTPIEIIAVVQGNRDIPSFLRGGTVQ